MKSSPAPKNQKSHSASENTVSFKKQDFTSNFKVQKKLIKNFDQLF